MLSALRLPWAAALGVYSRVFILGTLSKFWEFCQVEEGFLYKLMSLWNLQTCVPT